MKMQLVLIAVCSLTGLAGGCSKNNFPEYIALGDLRILTMIIDQPEVNPGTLVNITPVISDYRAEAVS